MTAGTVSAPFKALPAFLSSPYLGPYLSWGIFVSLWHTPVRAWECCQFCVTHRKYVRIGMPAVIRKCCAACMVQWQMSNDNWSVKCPAWKLHCIVHMANSVFRSLLPLLLLWTCIMPFTFHCHFKIDNSKNDICVRAMNALRVYQITSSLFRKFYDNAAVYGCTINTE